MRLIDIEAPCKIEIELDGEKCHATVTAHTVDAVPVVRCKDCRYLKVVNKEPIYAVCEKNNHTFYLWEEDTRESYCSRGERKDEADK